ncbi:MAG: hypothetical protein AMXMBFR33_04390 [Candidatus Xenobia bacterium]
MQGQSGQHRGARWTQNPSAEQALAPLQALQELMERLQLLDKTEKWLQDGFAGHGRGSFDALCLPPGSLLEQDRH